MTIITIAIIDIDVVIIVVLVTSTTNATIIVIAVVAITITFTTSATSPSSLEPAPHRTLCYGKPSEAFAYGLPPRPHAFANTANSSP